MDTESQPLPSSDVNSPLTDGRPFEPGPFSVPPPPGPGARRIFLGPYGLRAGWSLLIYFAILFSIAFGIRAVHDYNKHKAHPAAAAAVAARQDPNAPMRATDAIEQEGIAFSVILAISLVMALIERRRVSAYGLGGQRAVSRFLVGTVWGLAAMGLLIGALRLLHLLSFDAQLDHGWQIVRFGALQLAGFLFVGLLEEYMFRGYLQFTLTRGLVGLSSVISRQHGKAVAFWIATLITSALFFLAHTGNSGEDKVGLLLVFLAGVAFVVALWRTGSLWWAIGFHMAWDWSQSFLYGVPDSGLLVQGRMFATHAMGNPVLSGGTVGPEGSVLCIPVLLLVIVVLLFTSPAPLPPLETKKQLAAVALPQVEHAAAV